jgi:hypothetical protein
MKQCMSKTQRLIVTRRHAETPCHPHVEYEMAAVKCYIDVLGPSADLNHSPPR